MSTFDYPYRYGVQTNVKVRSTNAQFGDGYSQGVLRGINNQIRTYALTFVEDDTDITIIDDFLANESGVQSFVWQPPTGDSGNFICMAWNRHKTSYNVDTLTATFIEKFE